MTAPTAHRVPPMPDDDAFPDLVRRVRGGDQAAAADLVRLYEPELRRAVRVRLTDPNLRRAVDSADICQSVLAAFFVRVVAGQFDLDEPTQLVRLLATMGRNKVTDHARKPENRDTRTGDPAVWAGSPGDGDTPSAVAAEAELVAEARRRLSPDELTLIDRRAGGAGWAEIAADLRTSPDAARKRYERALDRVSGELGLGRLADA